ncbi:hypothetical protein B0H17DRAFT_1208800 [Mycena rosella]|uniref:Uncharacterized protein n=1 Tax=Mycena rosella TaxID=1033263 RepID=A0AAD7D093_MYCRO|nr:hypothetical protein B0H17DRAFT_1208800 [Mycena rosella]
MSLCTHFCPRDHSRPPSCSYLSPRRACPSAHISARATIPARHLAAIYPRAAHVPLHTFLPARPFPPAILQLLIPAPRMSLCTHFCPRDHSRPPSCSYLSRAAHVPLHAFLPARPFPPAIFIPTLRMSPARISARAIMRDHSRHPAAISLRPSKCPSCASISACSDRASDVAFLAPTAMTERKKRKNAGGAPSNHPPKKAKTPGCTICPGSPNPLQCMHTEAGRTFLATRTALLSKTRVVTPTKPTSAWGEQTPQSFTGSSPDSSPAPYRAPNAPLNPYIRGGGIMQPQFHPQQFPPQFRLSMRPSSIKAILHTEGMPMAGGPGTPPPVRDIRRLVSRTTPTTMQSQESVAGVQPERLTDLQTTLLPPRTPPQIDPLLSEP